MALTLLFFLIILAISKPLPYCDEGSVQIGIVSMCKPRER